MGALSSKAEYRVVGRYAIYDVIASGGMASVHLGRLVGEAGFARTVAIKRLHPRLAEDPQFVAMFLDEAHMASRVTHPNVVSVLDVVAADGELFLVMDYVHGETLARLMVELRERKATASHRIAAAIVSAVLHGLHAAHEAVDETGTRLKIVHRDVSPQNVMIGVDGLPRVLDFGVAKARNRMCETREGDLKGKLHYMAPEQLGGGAVSRRTDVYACGLLLWELLTGERFNQSSKSENLRGTRPVAPSEHSFDNLGATFDSQAFAKLRNLDAIVARAIHPEPTHRFTTARDMAIALEKAVSPASSSEIAEWLMSLAADRLRARSELVAYVEGATHGRRPGLSSVRKMLARHDAAATIESPRSPAPNPTLKKVKPPIDDRRPRESKQAPTRETRSVVLAALLGAGAGLAAIVAVSMALRGREESELVLPTPTISQDVPRIVREPEMKPVPPPRAEPPSTAPAAGEPPTTKPHSTDKRGARVRPDWSVRQ